MGDKTQGVRLALPSNYKKIKMEVPHPDLVIYFLGIYLYYFLYLLLPYFTIIHLSNFLFYFSFSPSVSYYITVASPRSPEGELLVGYPLMMY